MTFNQKQAAAASRGYLETARGFDVFRISTYDSGVGDAVSMSARETGCRQLFLCYCLQ